MTILYKTVCLLSLPFTLSLASIAQPISAASSSSTLGNKIELDEPTPAFKSELSADLFEDTPAACSYTIPTRTYFAASLNEEDEQYNVHGTEYRDAFVNLNMMECVDAGAQKVVSGMPQFPVNSLIRPKYVVMSNVLSLSNQEAEAFFPIYARYEAEVATIPTESNDGDFDGLLARQQAVKEKYFNEMTRKSGAYLASRFLTWEDYYSATCKVN